MANTSYPSISTIFPVDQIPLNLGDFSTELEELFKNFFYRNLQIEISSDGDAKFYKMTLVTYTTLGVDTKGTGGIKLVLNPDVGTSGATAIDISVAYKLPILKYIKGLSLSEIASDPRAIFDLLLEITDVEEVELASRALELLVGADEDSLAVLTDTYNDLYPTQISNIETLQQFITTVEGAGEEGFDVIFSFISELTDGVEELIDGIKDLFQEILAGITFDDILKLFIPQALLSVLNLNMALQFPRKYLIPIDSIPGSPTLGETLQEPAVSQLTFNVGSLEYSTETGFHFQGESSFDFTKSQIGKSGLTIEILNMKLDLSRKTNIPEAIADGRPEDFIGVYAQEAIIGLPPKWFDQDSGATLGIIGRNLLIGTGGISGTIGLEAIGPNPASELVFTLGKKPPSGTRKGFKIGFQQFHMVWQQNSLIESSVKGSLTLPKFKQCTRQPDGTYISESHELRIDIEALFQQDGDFQITAKPAGGLSFCMEKTFIVTIDGLEVGKDDDKVFLCISGRLSFENNEVLKDIIKDPIEVKRLCVYSDGSFEIEGGSIPLPESCKLKLGPTEVFITNLTFGAEERDRGGIIRKYKYFGFDCGLSAGSAGLDLRGDGIAFYFTSDNDQHGGETNAHRFLKIAGIGIDLIIPGSASKETAAVLIQGYLSLKEEEYRGSIAFQLPKAKIAGGASMAMKPKVPAWVVDAFLEMAVPIPLGPSGLGIFGFRGLFGFQYLARKEAIGLTQDDKWFDYYKKDKPPGGKGVHTGKMYTPELNPNEAIGSSNPISIGAGLSLATTADDGKAFSLQAFFLISLPELIFIQGKANILGDRVGLTDDEPPFFAFVAFSPGHSVEFGLGADFKRQDSGKLIKINAEVEAGFFMQNSSAWYVNFGTKNKPINARILDLFNAYSYLMLSASGIEAGAGVTYGFDKKYGPVKASVGVYMDIWGAVSFERPQIGAGIALGGHVDVSIWGLGFYFSIATTLEATVPKPFRIAGTVEICVAVKLFIKKFEKCIEVQFVWEKDPNPDTSAISPLPTTAIPESSQSSPVSAVHIGSGKTYEISYFGAGQPSSSTVDSLTYAKVVPLDSFIDIQFEKAVDASPVQAWIGGVSNGPKGNRDLIPPKPAYKRVTHSYKVKAVNVMVWNGSNWADYHPYEALTVGSGAATSGVNPTDFKLGFFQKTGKEYNKIRFLAQTPFSYMETSSGGYIPEQMGITSSTLFCEETKREWHCARWSQFLSYSHNQWYNHQGLTFILRNQDGSVMNFQNIFQIPSSLEIPKGATLEMTLAEDSVAVQLKLTSFSSWVKVRFFEADHQQGFVQYNEVVSMQKTNIELLQAVLYEDETRPIRKIIVEPAVADPQLILSLQAEIDQLQLLIYQGASIPGQAPAQLEQILQERKLRLEMLESEGCVSTNTGGTGGTGTTDPTDPAVIEAQIHIAQQELVACTNHLHSLEEELEDECRNCTELQETLEDCLLQIEQMLQQADLHTCIKRDMLKLRGQQKLNRKLLSLIFSCLEKDKEPINIQLQTLYDVLTEHIQACQTTCETLQDQVEEAQQHCEEIENYIQQLETFLENLENVNNPHDPTTLIMPPKCGTFLHEVCWLTEEDYLYNESIPGQAAIEEDYQLAQAAIENIISPIWRPNEKYLVHVKVSDKVNGGGDQAQDIYFGFQTKGPIGHYPESDIKELEKFRRAPDESVNTPLNPHYDNKVEVPETSLKFYLDMQRSYPDPTGKILNRKPLYYKHPRMLMFYTKPYVYHFFGTWDAYKGLPARSGQLIMQIKDPVEDMADANTMANSHSSPVFSLFPDTSVVWHDHSDPVVPEDIQVYGSIRNPEINNPDYPGAHCWTSGGDPIVPASKSTEIIPRHLKPLKLYTAIVKNKFEGVTKEVHRYVFQTSRFGNLAEHIDSYHLRDKDGNVKDAVFHIEVDLRRGIIPESVNIVRAFNIVENNPNNLDSYNKGLAETYADPFQRLLEGHFRLKALHPPIGLEINFIKEQNTGNVIAILICSVEPLNDPKIPFHALRNSVSVLEQGLIDYSYFPLFSKDRSKVVLMNTAHHISAGEIKIRFGYLEWAEQQGQYIEQATATTDTLIV